MLTETSLNCRIDVQDWIYGDVTNLHLCLVKSIQSDVERIWQVDRGSCHCLKIAECIIFRVVAKLLRGSSICKASIKTKEIWYIVEELLNLPRIQKMKNYEENINLYFIRRS